MSTRPAATTRRIEALDLLRGLAVFGILVVNVEQMFLPMFIADGPVAMIPGERGMLAAWAITDALFENKFITVFSLLFGAGFCLQWLRAEGDSRTFRRRYLRRLLVLALFGLVHAAFFYKADVLVIYALTALVVLPMRRLSARGLAIAGTTLLMVTVAWGTFISGPDAPEAIALQRRVADEIDSIRETGVVTVPRHEVTEYAERAALADPEEGVEFRLPMPSRPAILVLDGNNDFEQAKIEYVVFSRGPIGAATFSRVSFLAALLLLYTPFYLLWRTLALFLLGAAVVKAGLLESQSRRTWRRTAVLGFGLGLPLTIVATTLRAQAYDTQGPPIYWSHALHDISSLMLALGLGAAALLVCTHSPAGVLRRALGAVGRTALTNYIGQSVAMSLVATSYGLGLFGDLTRLQILGLSVICFVAQVALSRWWLGRFRMGPLEWLWRCATYWRRFPMRSST